MLKPPGSVRLIPLYICVRRERRLAEFSLSFSLLVLRYVFGVEEKLPRERKILVDEN